MNLGLIAVTGCEPIEWQIAGTSLTERPYERYGTARGLWLGRRL